MKGGTKIKYRFTRLMTGSDLSMRRLPVMTAVSDQKGPVVWLTACLHGDEVGGMVVIHEIFKIIRKKGLLKGELHAFPLMNPVGFENLTRHIPLSLEDLNRAFPGKEVGRLAERIAKTIFDSILLSKPELVIDLHNDWKNSIPYVILDPIENSGLFSTLYDVAVQTGQYIVKEDEIIQNSLTYNLIQRDIKAFTFELGESQIVNEKNVNSGVFSLLKVLAYKGMVENSFQDGYELGHKKHKSNLLHYNDKPFCSSTGIIRFNKNAGDIVKKNQVIAKVYNVFGKKLETLLAPGNAVVLARTDSSAALPGFPVMAFGQFSNTC